MGVAEQVVGEAFNGVSDGHLFVSGLSLAPLRATDGYRRGGQRADGPVGADGVDAFDLAAVTIAVTLAIPAPASRANRSALLAGCKLALKARWAASSTA
jgi:hypothetical protein